MFSVLYMFAILTYKQEFLVASEEWLKIRTDVCKLDSGNSVSEATASPIMRILQFYKAV